MTWLVLLAAAAAGPNHPPVLENVPEHVDARTGQAVDFELLALDADRDPVRVVASGLPAGARFDAQALRFTWTPSTSDAGTYVVTFTASDGVDVTRRAVTLTVTRVNRPPVFAPQQYSARRGQKLRVRLDARDPDGDGLAYTARDLPPGAELDGKTGDLSWAVPEDAPGEVRFDATVSDGQASATARIEVRVDDAAGEEWTSYFIPGASYLFYAPVDDGAPYFQGAAAEVLIATWIHRNENRGPSHGKVALDVGLLVPGGSGEPILSYSLGASLSFERNARRRYLIPFYGLALGGLSQRALGHVFEVVPQAGVHLFVDRNAAITVAAGYVFPFAHLEALRGWQVTGVVNFSLW